MKKKAAELEKDEKGHTVMSLKNLEKCCQEEGLYATPELNDKLYLHFKGFHKIDNLHRFTELKALWLNNNAITQIENLAYCRQLVTLYLNNNIIKKIEGLENLELLSILNLSFNRIEKIEGLSAQKKLNTLSLTNNLLASSESLQGIRECPSVANFDLSNNEIANQEDALTVFSQMPELTVLYLRNSPIARGFKNYRKRFVSSMPKLKFLDDRPVTSNERRLCEAWSKGGAELENVEKSKLFDQREAANRKNYEDFEKLAGPPRERRKRLFQELAKAKIAELQQLRKQKKDEQEQPQEQALEGLIALNGKITQIERYLAQVEQLVSTATVRDGWNLQDYKLVSTVAGLRLINLEEEREKIRLNQQTKQQQQEKWAMWGLTKQGQRIDEPIAAEEFKPEELPLKLIEEQEKAQRRNIMQKWDSRFEPMLQLLLEKHQFDFEQVYPQFNMAIGEMYRKLGQPVVRFQGKQLRQIWTFVEKEKRNHLQDLD